MSSLVLCTEICLLPLCYQYLPLQIISSNKITQHRIVYKWRKTGLINPILSFSYSPRLPELNSLDYLWSAMEILYPHPRKKFFVTGSYLACVDGYEPYRLQRLEDSHVTSSKRLWRDIRLSFISVLPNAAGLQGTLRSLRSSCTYAFLSVSMIYQWARFVFFLSFPPHPMSNQSVFICFQYYSYLAYSFQQFFFWFNEDVYKEYIYYCV